MPLYEYRCNECTAEFEVLVRTVSSDPRPSCPACGATEVRKVLSLVAARPSRRGESGALETALAQPRGGGCCGGACGCGH